jgi:hypothetical protein
VTAEGLYEQGMVNMKAEQVFEYGWADVILYNDVARHDQEPVNSGAGEDG